MKFDSIFALKWVDNEQISFSGEPIVAVNTWALTSLNGFNSPLQVNPSCRNSSDGSEPLMRLVALGR